MVSSRSCCGSSRPVVDGALRKAIAQRDGPGFLARARSRGGRLKTLDRSLEDKLPV